MKKTIFIVLGITVVGLVYFLTNESKEKNVSQSKTQEIVEKHETNVEKIFPAVEKNKSLKEQTISPEEETKMIISEFRRTIPEMIKDTKYIPECLDKAKNTQEAFSCYEGIDSMHQGLSDLLDLDEADYNASEINTVWNEEAKLKMVDELKEEESALNKIQICIKDISTVSELKKCLDDNKKN